MNLRFNLFSGFCLLQSSCTSLIVTLPSTLPHLMKVKLDTPILTIIRAALEQRRSVSSLYTTPHKALSKFHRSARSSSIEHYRPGVDV
jgi:hypothetical protein